ncbi:carbohydrate porin, partial [Bradyrhizobium liaoningense]|uniref:carbohydrate porin n=1 Tax=Bradyrhizobium liaoningense TaxID=43992 RepID=UPI001BA93FB4
LDRDFASLNGPAWPVRSSEALVTAVYQYEVQPGLTLQPNFQFIRHPGGGGTDPLGAMRGKPLKDAAVLGLRSVIKF